jgi:hypothetical protein
MRGWSWIGDLWRWDTVVEHQHCLPARPRKLPHLGLATSSPASGQRSR